jgi:hypothetical protein
MSRGHAPGIRTPDPLLAKPVEGVQHRRWPRTMPSKTSVLVQQCPSPLVSVVGVTEVSCPPRSSRRLANVALQS